MALPPRLLTAALLLLLLAVPGSASPFCVSYFTGIGCSHCAQADPLVLGTWLDEYPDLVVIEFEIYQQPENAGVLDRVVDQYNLSYGIPALLFSENEYYVGEKACTTQAPAALNATGRSRFFLEETDLTALAGLPKIWFGDRILIRTGSGGNDTLLKALLTTRDLDAVLEGVEFVDAEPVQASWSSGEVSFDYAITLDSWIFQWRGDPLGITGGTYLPTSPPPTTAVMSAGEGITLSKVFTLAVADAVNPCALAVLLLLLLAILTNDPRGKKKVLFAGIAFSVAVLLFYLLYGVILIQAFILVEFLTGARSLLHILVGVAAVVLGLINLKELFDIGFSGRFSRMPSVLRPFVKRVMSGIATVPGAFVSGAVVSLFLLPCTIGPYIIAAEILAGLDTGFVASALIVYNLIFIAPFLAITVVVWAGFAKIEDISGWKDAHMRILHGIAGSIMLVIGLGMIAGLF